MKTIKKIGFVAFAALAMVMSSCSGDDEGGGGGGSSLDTYVNATVDGTAFKTYSIQGNSLGAALKTDQLISVTGSSVTSATDMQNVKSINITLMGITAPGTYEINAESESVLAYVDSALEKSWDTSNCDGVTATVKVTTLNDTKIEGTFTFTGADDENCSSKKVVTNGKFRGTFMQN